MSTASLIPFIAAAAWFACGVLSAGMMFAFNQRRYRCISRQCFGDDQFMAAFAILVGPIGLAATFITYGFFSHGWLWPWSAKAKREAGIV